MNEFLLILGMALVTFGVRYPVLAFLGRVTLPPLVQRGLTFVPPVVLAAIIAPVLLMPDGATLDLGLDNAYLVAGVATVGVAWWSGRIAPMRWRGQSLLITIVLGMAVFLAWRWLI